MGMQDFAVEIAREAHVIWDAPYLYLASMAIVALVIWKMVQWQVGTRLEHANGRLSLAEDRANEYQRKLSGASPDEAKARMDHLEGRLKVLEPRRVTAEQRQSIVTLVSPGNGRAISIAADGACTDANGVARGLAAAFGSAGWHVQTPMVMGLGFPPPSGIGIQISDPSSPTDDQSLIMQSLRDIGLEFDIQVGARPSFPGQPQFVAELVITNRVLD